MDDLEPTLDQSGRIARRMAHGVYRIFHNRKEVGEELWGIFGLLGGGYRLMTEISLRWPVPNHQRAQLDLDENWRERKLFVQLDAQGKRRNAYYTVAENGAEVNVFEELLRYADPAGRNSAEQPFQPAVGPRPKRMFGDTLAYDDNTFFDFGSTLMNFAHLQRLDMRANTQAQMRMIVVTQPSLEPLVLAQTYRYEREEVVSTQAQPAINARRYVIEEEGTGNGPQTTIWTDERGVAVKQEVLLGKDTHGCELVNYTWHSD